MTNKEILYRINGSITPYGSSEIDESRFENLKSMCSLVRDLVDDIRDVAKYKNRPEHSMKTMAQYAAKFLEELNKTTTNE